jgi:gamma-glutamyltranspeptidase/glutathione hydrolase
MRLFILSVFSIFFITACNASDLKPGKGIIATSNSHASKAASEILKRGGNAIDAAIAVQLVLTLTEPQATGIGGGAFMLYWDARQSKLFSLDGRETAPSRAKDDLFLDKSGNKKPFYPDAVIGVNSVGVPGVIRLLEESHKKFGRLEWAKLFDYAITLSEDGFAVSPDLNRTLSYLSYLKTIEPAASLYYQEGVGEKKEPLPVGHIFRNQEYAKTLRRIASLGAIDFYEGETADLIINALKEFDSKALMTLSDLKNYEIIWREPLCQMYRSYNICSMPPPSSGGLTMLIMLKILEDFDIKSLKPESKEMVHLFSEASRLAYADRGYYMADPDFVKVPVDGLLSDEYIDQRRSLINQKELVKEVTHGRPKGALDFEKNIDISKPSTSHFVIVDNEGNAVSMTSTVEGPFGSHLMAGGFILNNELTDFSMIPEVNGKKIANRVEGNKRPMSSMTPTIIFKDSNLFALTGSPGGTSIINYVTKSVLGLIDWNLDPKDIVKLPHYMNKGKVTELEENTILEDLQSDLEAMGHRVRVMPKRSGLHIALKKPTGYVGGADPRREGLVLNVE